MRSDEREMALEATRTVNFFWSGQSIPLWNRLCIRSFVMHGFEAVLWSYEGIDLDGVQSRDASEVVSRSIFSELVGEEAWPLAHFCDLFRYRLLERTNGWYCDADMLCISDVKTVAEIVGNDSRFICGWQDEGIGVNNAVMLSIGSDIPAQCSNTLKERVANAYKGYKGWGYLGPVLITEVIKSCRVNARVLEQRAFYPIHYSNALILSDPDSRADVETMTAGALFVHLWDGIQESCGIPRDMLPPEGSWLEEQFRLSMDNKEERHVALPYKTFKILIRYRGLQEALGKILGRHGASFLKRIALSLRVRH